MSQPSQQDTQTLPTIIEQAPAAGADNLRTDSVQVAKKTKEGLVEFGLAPVFPLYGFSAKSNAETNAGSAHQGMALSAGRYLPFSPESRTGWYFGAGYSGMRMAGFPDSLALEYTDEGGALRKLSIPDESMRYHIVTLRTGLSFEGKSENVAAYGRLLFNLNYVDASNFDVRIDAEAHTAKVLASVTSGYSLEFGFRFEQNLSIGVAWTYMGSTRLAVELPAAEDQGLSPFPNRRPTELSNLFQEQRIQLLEVKVGYAF